MSRLSFLMSWAWDFLRPTVQRLLSTHGRALADAAIEAVRIMEGEPDLPGKVKLEHATAMVLERLRQIGADFAKAEIQAAIHAALLRIRG